MIKESAANTDIICRRIDNNVPLSIVPSDPTKKAFKAKNILKSKPKSKIPKEKDKENAITNAQNQSNSKIQKKPKSLIPKPSSKSNNKLSRKGEFYNTIESLAQTYANTNVLDPIKQYEKQVSESKERERFIPTKLSSRKSSLGTSTSKPPKKTNVSKTEMLYQQARMALGKSKKQAG